MVRTRALRPAAFVGLLLAAVLGGFALAPAAFAHHPDITGTTACDTSVTFTSTAWVAGTSAERTNPKIAIAYAVNGSSTYTTLTQKAAYRYDAANQYTFTDTFTPPAGWTSVKLRATAIAAWADGAGPGDTRTSASILPKTGCSTPPTTTPPTTAPPTTTPSTTPTTRPPSTTPTTAPSSPMPPASTPSTTPPTTPPSTAPTTTPSSPVAPATTPSGEVLGASATAAPPVPAPTGTAPASVSALPRTGGPVLLLAGLALLALASGIGFVLLGRRETSA